MIQYNQKETRKQAEKERGKKMKAYITFFNKDNTTTKVVWALDEAKKNLKKKDFEKLCDWTGIHNSRMTGYIA